MTENDSLDMNEPYDDPVVAAEVERNYRWNFMANFMDLALFWFGASFMSGMTIVPLYVQRASGSRLLVGLVAALSQAGWYLPQLFTANYVERRPRRKSIVVKIGFVSERLPLWLLPLSAFVLVPANPWPALAIFFVGYAWHCLGAGAIAPAWQDLLARVIPTDRRGRFFGLSNFAGSALGVVGALISASLLARYPFPKGFAFCFALGAASILASWAFLALIREPPVSTAKEPVSLRTYFRQLPSVLRRDPNFSSFLVSRVASGMSRMAIGFVTVYAVGRWGLPDSVAGTFTTVLLVSQMAAYLLLGFVADRKGHKVVLEWGTLVAVLTLVFCLVAPSPAWFYLAFVGLGINTAADILSGLMIVLNTTMGVFSALSPLLGGWLASVFGYPILFVLSAGMAFVAFVILHWFVQEPRKVNGRMPS